jgi:hypothetical protein
MTDFLKARTRRRRRSLLFSILFLAILSVSVLISAEFLLRLKGERPFQTTHVEIDVEPGGRFFAKHPTLGYTHIPGQFRITLKGSHSFTVTHRNNTLRITHPLETYRPESSKDEIWLFGGSFTHGWSLQDKETYPWLLQKSFPKYEIVNFGVSGCGTLHSLIQFQEALKKRKNPRIAMIAYASFHDSRNTFLRSRRKAIAPWVRLGPLLQPYARIKKGDSLIISMATVEYHEFPLMRRSALFHFIEKRYNRIEDRFYESRKVSQAIITDFYRLATLNGIRLIILGVTSDPATFDMLEYAQSQGIDVADISVDLSKKENTNLPVDGHPSARANVQYALKLETLLNKLELK